jgi:hypothetical protein
MPVQHAEAVTTPVYRPQPKFQVEIYRDGKSSESVSFMREALADTGRHHSVASAGDSYSAVSSDDHSSDEAAASDASASKDGSAPAHASNSRGPTLPPSETVPADESASSASLAPKGKTIDIP